MSTNKSRRSGRGRPEKGSEDRKSESLLLRLEPREKETFSEAAKVAGVPLSVWIRERLRKVARGELQEAGHPFAL
jgi:predicted HicB family RNase H-like nuclease